MKVSFCAPATFRHHFLLQSFLQRINSFIDKPDEIVISFSEVDSVEKEEHLKSCSSNLTDIPVRLIFNKEKKLAGGNRNVCIENASHDLLIFSDIDDVCHPSRIRVIKHIFENNKEICHLTHSYVRTQIGTNLVLDNSGDNLLYKITPEEVSKNSAFTITDKMLHNGAVAFLKSKIGNIRYKESQKDFIIYEDQDFNIEVMNSTEHCYFLDSKLYYYMIGFNTAGV